MRSADRFLILEGMAQSLRGYFSRGILKKMPLLFGCVLKAIRLADDSQKTLADEQSCRSVSPCAKETGGEGI